MSLVEKDDLAKKRAKKSCKSDLPILLPNLPDDIICYIISLLPYKEAVRSSALLSKRFRSSWLSFPNIVICDSLIYSQRHKYNLFLSEACDFLRSRCINGAKSHNIRLRLLRAKSDPQAKHLMDLLTRLALENCIGSTELHLGLLRLPNNADIFSSSMSLTTLRLVRVSVFDNVLQDIVRNKLPELEFLFLDGVKGLTNVIISSARLKSLKIVNCFLESINVDARNLEHSTFRCECSINMSSNCELLRSLELDHSTLTNLWIRRQLPRLPSLHCLKLNVCYGLGRIHIFHEELRSLKIKNCCQLVETKLDTPKLCTLDCYHQCKHPSSKEDTVRCVSKFTKGLKILNHSKDLTVRWCGA